MSWPAQSASGYSETIPITTGSRKRPELFVIREKRRHASQNRLRDNAAEALFLDLVTGMTAETLDDGEAATQVRRRAGAAIDEPKARSLARRRFKGLVVRSTTKLMFDALPYDDGMGGP